MSSSNSQPKLIAQVNECLQPHGLEIRLGLNVPEAEFKEGYGKNIQYFGNPEDLAAVFQL
jgi:hypothetical protein